MEEAKKETLRGLFQFWTGVSSIRMFEETFHSEYKYTKRTFELWVKHQLEESHSQLRTQLNQLSKESLKNTEA